MEYNDKYYRKSNNKIEKDVFTYEMCFILEWVCRWASKADGMVFSFVDLTFWCWSGFNGFEMGVQSVTNIMWFGFLFMSCHVGNVWW